MSYTHLTERDRYVLGHQRAAGWSLSSISESIGRSKGTVSRELRRNRLMEGIYDGYWAVAAAGRRRGESRTEGIRKGVTIECHSVKLFSIVFCGHSTRFLNTSAGRIRKGVTTE